MSRVLRLRGYSEAQKLEFYVQCQSHIETKCVLELSAQLSWMEKCCFERSAADVMMMNVFDLGL